MKKNYTFFLFILLISFSGKAQYTITNASMPLVGDVDIQHSCTNTLVPLGSGGTGQTWNYAFLNVDWTSYPITFVSMSAVANASLFPTGTIGASNGSGNANIYENTSAASKVIGYSDPLVSNCFVYSNPVTVFTFPFSYGTTFTDTYSGSYSMGIFNGTVTTSGHGSGVLLTPGMTFSNVIKVRYSSTETQISGSAIDNYIGIQDNFYNSSSKFPLLTVMNYTFTSSTSTMVSIYQGAQINHFAYTGINEISETEGISVFPNPITTNQVNLLFSTATEDDYSGTIYDQLGRTVKNFSVSRQECNEKKVSISLPHLEGGVYFLQLSGAKNKFTQKLIIE